MLKYLILLSVIVFTGCSLNDVKNIELQNTNYKGFTYNTTVKRDTYIKTKLEFQLLGNIHSEDVIFLVKSEGKYRLKDLESIVFVSNKLIVKPKKCNLKDENNQSIAECIYDKKRFFDILNGKSFYISFNTTSGQSKYTTTTTIKHNLNKGTLDYCVSYARNMIKYIPNGNYSTIYYKCLNNYKRKVESSEKTSGGSGFQVSYSTYGNKLANLLNSLYLELN